MAVEKGKKDESSKAEETTQNNASEGEGVQMIPLSEVDALIQARLKEMTPGGSGGLTEELAKALVTIANNSEQAQEAYDPAKYLSPAQVASDDILEEVVVFWASGFGLVLGDDKKNGIPIRPPYGAVLFEPVGENRQQRGKDIDVNIWSKHVCESKKELEFLRNHTLFGIRFFEKAGETINVDQGFAIKLANHMTALRNTPSNQVHRMAREMELAFEEDLDKTRLMIASALIEKEKAQYAAANQIRVKNETREAEMISQLK